MFQHKVALHNVPHLPLVCDLKRQKFCSKRGGAQYICIETFNGFYNKVFFLSLSPFFYCELLISSLTWTRSGPAKSAGVLHVQDRDGHLMEYHCRWS